MKKLEGYLPVDVMSEITKYGRINEIRIKRNAYLTVKKDGRYFVTERITDDRCFDGIVDKLLEHSYHSKLSQLIEGYISLGEGYRAGIAGQAVIKDGTVTNLSEIGSVNIRVPYLIRNVCVPVVEYLEKKNFSKGALIYSPPGVGKTTLLRDLIISLCSAPYLKRLSVIDTRNEIYQSCMGGLPMLDMYSGYPKHKGIEQAIRTMAPDILVCDEIGNDAETDAIISNQSAGVPIIATAHGDCYSELINRRNITRMHSTGVFGCYIGIKRRGINNRYDFEFTERRDGI
ncbi:MAG: hypothetical protein IJB57_08740 [Clostridia bacterium]|nr:hypothetical protein [Clostridia bacterium]